MNLITVSPVQRILAGLLNWKPWPFGPRKYKPRFDPRTGLYHFRVDSGGGMAGDFERLSALVCDRDALHRLFVPQHFQLARLGVWEVAARVVALPDRRADGVGDVLSRIIPSYPAVQNPTLDDFLGFVATFPAVYGERGGRSIVPLFRESLALHVSLHQHDVLPCFLAPFGQPQVDLVAKHAMGDGYRYVYLVVEEASQVDAFKVDVDV